MSKDDKRVKVHWPREERDERGNLIMWCGKVFADGDRKRLQKHVTTLAERVNCRECVRVLSMFWDGRPNPWWFDKESNNDE